MRLVMFIAAALTACSSSTDPAPSPSTEPAPRVVAEAGVTGSPAGDGTHALGDSCTPNTTCGTIHTASCATGDDSCKTTAFCGGDGRCAFFCNYDGSTTTLGTLQALCSALGGACTGTGRQVCSAP